MFTPFRDRYTIDVPGPDDLEPRGDLFDHDFTVERGGQIVATASRRLLSVRDTYAVDVAAGEDDGWLSCWSPAWLVAGARPGRASRPPAG